LETHGLCGCEEVAVKLGADASKGANTLLHFQNNFDTTEDVVREHYIESLIFGNI
jgi:hypothetical protein